MGHIFILRAYVSSFSLIPRPLPIRGGGTGGAGGAIAPPKVKISGPCPPKTGWLELDLHYYSDACILISSNSPTIINSKFVEPKNSKLCNSHMHEGGSN